MINFIVFYIVIGFFTSLFINDSGKLSTFKHIFAFVFWLPLIILRPIPFIGTYVNKWIFGE